MTVLRKQQRVQGKGECAKMKGEKFTSIWKLDGGERLRAQGKRGKKQAGTKVSWEARGPVSGEN